MHKQTGHAVWQAAANITDRLLRQNMMVLLVDSKIDVDANFWVTMEEAASATRVADARVSATSIKWTTPLIFAIENNHATLVSTLLKAKADVSVFAYPNPTSAREIHASHRIPGGAGGGGGGGDGSDNALAAAIRHGEWDLVGELLTGGNFQKWAFF